MDNNTYFCYKYKDMQKQIWQLIASMRTPGFFITAEMNGVDSTMPVGLETFIFQKLENIRLGLKARRFVYQENGWRIYLTFFPTDRVVDEKFALKNKVMSRRYS